eukprot:3256668-Pleurochrysis_carterae.AAC.1
MMTSDIILNVVGCASAGCAGLCVRARVNKHSCVSEHLPSCMHVQVIVREYICVDAQASGRAFRAVAKVPRREQVHASESNL